MIRALLLFLCAMLLVACQPEFEQQTVVVYTSVDQPHAEPVLKAFERNSGIRVRAVYDVEATKSVGLATRLLAEKERPQADVFWSGEFVQTLMLKRQGILAPYRSPAVEGFPAQYTDHESHWSPLAGRARVLLINRQRLARDRYPQTLRELVELAESTGYGNRIGIAYPMFGTTATHAAALYAAWGPEDAKAYFARLRAAHVRVVDGNSVVRDLVASGELALGLTDTDDACSALKRGAPVDMVFLDQDGDGLGTLIIPGTVALVANAPHPQEGKALIDYLVGREVETQLLASGWSDIPYRVPANLSACGDHRQVKGMSLGLVDVEMWLERSRRELGEIFIR